MSADRCVVVYSYTCTAYTHTYVLMYVQYMLATSAQFGVHIITYVVPPSGPPSPVNPKHHTVTYSLLKLT